MRRPNGQHSAMRKLMILAAPLLIAAAPPPTDADIGPEPATQEARAITEQAIKARLIDPDSARIEWPYAFTGGSLKGLFSKRRVGWISCGLVNSRNRMGGYSGQAYFAVVIHNGAIDMLDIGESQDIDIVGMSCQKMVSSGFLHPAPVIAPTASTPVSPVSNDQLMAAVQANAQTAAAKGGIGITFMPSPVGAILMAVSPGSRADKAGLKAGETIEAINGIPIKGMDQGSIGAILHSDAPSLVVKVVGVGDLTINH